MDRIAIDAHNAEVEEVWQAYRRKEPIRVPVILGTNVRFTMPLREVNPKHVTFEQYVGDPDVMLELQLAHQKWARFNLIQDAEMGLPKNGWTVWVDFQNTYEAAWFGCPLRFHEDQVPDTEPLLANDSKKSILFDMGIPDPFKSGIMARNWDYYGHFLGLKEKGYTYKGAPLGDISPCGLGTDGPVTVACNLRGTTQFLADLAADPEYARQLMDFITEATIVRIQAYRKRLGQPLKTPGWGFADDSIQLISTAMYEEMVFPFHKRLVDTFSETGPNSIHLCGDATRQFPFLKNNLNMQAFDTGFPVDFAWLREALGPEVEVLGGPSVPFLIQATPAEVREEVRRILGSGIMRGGRFTLREGNNLAPGTPLENLRAMYNAGKEFGCYG